MLWLMENMFMSTQLVNANLEQEIYRKAELKDQYDTILPRI